MRPVPWIDWGEWSQVCKRIADEESAERVYWALRRIQVWRYRTATLPHAVESTAQLTHALLADRGCGAFVAEEQAKLVFAMVVIRAVNGLVDPAQRGSHALPVAALASQVEVPPWIVDLRHQASHNSMPSLPVLRAAARYLLAWFRQHYWGAQAEQLPPGTVRQARAATGDATDDGGVFPAKKRARTLSASDPPTPQPAALMSLPAVDSASNGNGDAAVKFATASSAEVASPWISCQSWAACPIGSLPLADPG